MQTTQQSQAPAPKRVKVGELFELSARENLSTGYETLAELDPEALELMGDLTDHNASDRQAIGSATTKIFQFRALKAGPTRVVWRSRRAWESGPGQEQGFQLIEVEPA